MVGCWALWEHRNKVVFDSKEVDPRGVIRRVIDVMEEIEGGGFIQKKEGVGECGNERRSEQRGWVAPQAGYVKVNVDAGIKEDAGVSLGVVCREERGKVLWGVSSVVEQVWEPQVAEAVAVYEGVREAMRRNHTHVVVESDCLSRHSRRKSQAGVF
ncbi:uncharacterized protein LOC141649670 [Silene latifolia]|uniref:uncharacterized protein LOC141649670 n=1 Tax=Silene latifolia TaxID=37657 RepID=UPI003D786E7D